LTQPQPTKRLKQQEAASAFVNLTADPSITRDIKTTLGLVA
jgi:hypothetical protein